MTHAQSNAALTGPYRIAGTVVNAVTGQPVGGAAVAILTAEDSHTLASTVTGSDGHFALVRLPAAKFELNASKRGYLTSFFDQHGDFNSAIVTGDDQETGDLVFELAPNAVLSGVITGDGGDPVQGAKVMLFRRPADHGSNDAPEEAGTMMTDDTGSYEFSGLAAGEYLLAVQATPWYAMHHFEPGEADTQETENEAALDVAYPVTYFDSTTDEASATPIELTSGSRQEANVNLHAVPALHLILSVSQDPGTTAPPSDLRQVIFGTEADGGTDMVSVGHGEITEFYGLAPGEYHVQQGNPPREADMNLSASQQLDASAGAPAVEVKGWLRSAEGAPVSGATLSLNPRAGTAGKSISATSDKTGNFSFPAVPPGRWSLQVMTGGIEAATAMPVMAIAEDGQTHAGDRVTVSDGPVSLVARVSTHPARMEGFARKNGKGVSGAMVVLVPKDLGAMASLARRDQSDSDGSFTLLDVAPGEYTIVAIADGWDDHGQEIDWADPAVIGRYLPGGLSVTVKDELDSTAGAQSPRRIQLAGAVQVQAR